MDQFFSQSSHSFSPESESRASRTSRETRISSKISQSEAGDVDPEGVKYLKDKSNKLDKWIQSILQDKNIRRFLALPDSLKSMALLSVDYGKSGTYPSASMPSASLAHSPGALNRLVNLLKEVDRKYRESEGMEYDKLQFSPFRERVEQQPIHRFDVTGAERFARGCETWQLIQAGAEKSYQIYGDTEKVCSYNPKSNDEGDTPKPDEWKDNQKGDIKTHNVYMEEIDGQPVAVVAVKGTVGLLDWLQNLDDEPKKDKRVGSASYHEGLLKVALAMEEKIAEAIEHEIEGFDTQNRQYVSVLFTGHSAGGAVAQLFYAMSSILNNKMFRACESVEAVHCITFGTPPVSTERIPHGGRGQFLSVINEGDPVVLAQMDYAECLLEVYLSNTAELNERYPEGFKIPDLPFKVSGDCLLLRCAYTNELAPDSLKDWKVEPEKLEKRLFGNVVIHPCYVYMKRVKKLALRYANVMVIDDDS